MKWFRWYHDTASDTKLGVVALRSKQPKVAVIALWVYLLEEASKADDRGSLEFMDIEAAMLALSLDEEAIEAIIEAMNCKALIVDNRIANWEKRQPDSDTTEADRAKKYRDRKRHGRVTVASRDDVVTNGDRHGTEEETDQNREEKEITPLPPKGVGSRFDDFYSIYPNKKNKAKARSIWEREKLDRLADQIIAAVKRYATTPDWLKEGGKFVPHPTTFLNGKRWEDELTVQVSQNAINPQPKKSRLELLQEAISQGKAIRDITTHQIFKADRLKFNGSEFYPAFILLDDPEGATREASMLEVVL